MADLQSVGIPLRQNEPWMLLNGDWRTRVGARCGTAGGEAWRVHLCQVVTGRFPLQGQLDVEVLSNGRVHDTTCQYVGETTVITRAPVGRGGDTDKIYIAIIIKALCQYLYVMRVFKITWLIVGS